MSLRQKAFAITLLALTGFILLFLLSSRTIILESYLRLEEEQLRTDIERGRNALDSQLASLRKTVTDWAAWDDTYNFLADRNQAYRDANLQPATLENLDLDAILFIARDGHLAAEVIRDPGGRTEGSPSADLVRQFQPGSPLAVFADPPKARSGVLVTSAGPVLFAAHPIVPSNYAGPGRGVMVMSRLIDQRFIAKLAETTRLRLSLSAIRSPQIPATIRRRLAALPAGRAELVEPTDSETVTGWASVPDALGRPVIIMKVESKRTVWLRGQATVRTFLLGLLVAGFVLILGGVFLIDRLVIRRVLRLGMQVAAVRGSADPSGRVTASGKDELTSLAGEVNAMLAALQESQKALRESETRYRQLVEDAPVGIVVRDGNELIFVNQAAVRLFGANRPEDLLGRSFTSLVAARQRDEILAMREPSPAVREGKEQSEVDVVRLDGTPGFLEYTALSVFFDGRPAIMGIFQDIADRKAAEEARWQLTSELGKMVQARTAALEAANEAVLKSEKRFRAVVEAMDDVVFLLDREQRYLGIWGRWMERFGFTPEQFLGKTSWEIFGAENREFFDDLNRRVLAGETHAYERWFDLPGGGIYYHTTLTPVRDEAGRVIGIAGLGRDITARKQAEETLRESEAKFRTLAEQSPNMIFIIADKHILFVNQACVDATGYSREEFLDPAFDWRVLIAPESRARVEEMNRRFFAGEAIPSYDYRQVTRDGRRLDVIIATQMISFGGLPAMMGVVTDITERKRAEEALRESEEAYRQLFEAESDAILLLENESGKILQANQAASALYGYSMEELLAKRNTDLSAEPEETDRVTKSTAVDPLKVINIPLRLHRKKDGTVFPVEITGRFFVHNGVPVHLAAIRDITERKQAEEALLRAKAEMERQNEELRKLDRIRDGLVRDVSHELKTPVAKQAMQMDILKTILRKHGLEQETSQVMAVMEAAIVRQESAIRNILDLARLEAGVRTYRREPVRLDELAAKVVEDYRYASETHGIRVKIDLEAVTVTSDGEMLWHVISNMFNNAVKFRKPGVDAVIRVRVAREGAGALVAVSDNGIGLSPEEKTHVFQHFFKASPTAEGSGVGLSIARLIADGLGAEIDIESPGRGLGATVTLSIPDVPPAG